MPIGTLSRISKSLSQGGKCLSNLRGVTPSAPYDYAKPSRLFNIGGATGSISTVGSGNWSNTIRRAYYSTDSESDASIRYQGGVLSTATSGTILFRMYIQPFPNPANTPLVQTVFTNGAVGSDGYGIFLTHDEVAFETYQYNLHFGRLQDASSEWVKLNTTSGQLNESTWYQFSVRFTTTTIVEPKPTTFSEVVAYQDGILQIQTTMNNPITTPTSSTTYILGFYGRMTDYAFLESQLSLTQLAAYGTAPYI
jgi:hypothetical protein